MNYKEANQPARASNVNLDHYWRLIMGARWLMLTHLLLGRAPLSSSTCSKRRRFTRSTAGKSEIDKEEDAVMNIKAVTMLGELRAGLHLQTQYRILAQAHIINQVITNLHLERDPRYAKAKDLYKAVRRDVIISPVRLTRLVDVRAYHTDPQKAADIANEVAQVFIHENGKLKLDKTLEAIEQLTNSTVSLAAAASKADAALQAFKESNNVPFVEDSRNSTATQADPRQAPSSMRE